MKLDHFRQGPGHPESPAMAGLALVLLVALPMVADDGSDDGSGGPAPHRVSFTREDL